MLDRNKTIAACRFETDRLQVEHWDHALSDSGTSAALLAEISLLLTPAVTAYLPQPLCLSGEPDAVAEWVLSRRAESDVFCIRDKYKSEFVGLLILASFQESGQVLVVRLGYLLTEPAWGKGYATELIRGLLLWFQTRDISARLLGGVEPDNGASAAVLIKAGFHRQTEQQGDGSDMFQFDI